MASKLRFAAGVSEVISPPVVPIAPIVSKDETVNPVWPIEVAIDLDRSAFIRLHRARARPLILICASLSLVGVVITGLYALIFGRSADYSTYMMLSFVWLMGTVAPMILHYAATDSNYQIYSQRLRDVHGWVFAKNQIKVDLGDREEGLWFDWFVSRTSVRRGIAIIRTSSKGLCSEFAIQQSSFPDQLSWETFLDHVASAKSK